MLLRTAAALTLLLAVVIGTAARAQAPASVPSLPQEQFDSLVNAITTSVLEKLKVEGVAAPKPAEQKPRPFDVAPGEQPDALSHFVSQAVHIVTVGIPALERSFVDFASSLDNRAAGGRSVAGFLLLLVGAIVVAVTIEAVLRLATLPLHARLAASASPQHGARSLVALGALALIDGAGVLAVWLVSRLTIRLFFDGSSVQDTFAGVLLLAIVYWRLYVLAFRLVVRPALPAARLCAIEDNEARRLLRLVSAVVLVATIARALYLGAAAARMPTEAVAAGRVLTAPVLLIVLLVFAGQAREAMQQWLLSLARAAPWTGFVGRHWVPLASVLFVALVATQAYGAITGYLKTPNAVLLTMNLLVGVLMFETLLQALVSRLDGAGSVLAPPDDRPRLPDVLARCARVFVVIVVIVVLAESWVVNVMGLVDERAWDRLTKVGRSAGLTLFAAFVLWELFKYVTEAYLFRIAHRNLQGDEGDRVTGSVAARFDTLMPMVRLTVGVVIGVIAVLIVLDDLGINTAPLLAGASVLGLAISFGSQALVKDIVSGIFYLADDAFRVGEYIRCGQSEGTVEGFTLRSLRLRHPSGQLQVIPFGELGQISNYSRDWAAIEFNLRFARDTDLETLREATRKIGDEMMGEPELEAEILEPLKLKAVAEVAENALVVRFKLKSRPGNTGVVHDRALRWMLKAMPEHGIAFATST